MSQIVKIHPMVIHAEVRREINKFLIELPPMQSESGRKALLLGTGMGDIVHSIDFAGSTKEFVPRLINLLEHYGTVSDQEIAFIRFLEETKNWVGHDKQKRLQEFCHKLTGSPDRVETVCPYRGLFAFREEDEQFFFGRETYLKKIFEAFEKQTFISIIGASGSGKSSLVHAGIIPCLRRQADWLIIVFRPAEAPFRSIISEIIPLWQVGLSKGDRLVETKKVTEHIRQKRLTLRDILKDLIQGYPGYRLLLVADQFEELYTHCYDDKVRQLFLDELLAVASETENISHLVLTIRADFLSMAISYRPFADAFQNSDIVLGPTPC